MADVSSTPPSTNKPVIVRVKRKAFQSALDAFWLEIHERPLKRPLLDFGNLSISDVSSSKVVELKTRKILVRHVETVSSSESTFDVLRSFVPNLSGELSSEEKTEGKRTFNTVNKHDQILVKAKQSQEAISRNARFEQIWRSRKEKKEAPEDEAISEMCRLYDVVRVDAEGQVSEVQKQKDTDLDDHRMMAQYLPLLRDFLPSAAVEIESDICDLMSEQGSTDGYVYDFYAVNEDADTMEADSVNPFPLVRVDDDDEFYDGRDDSEYETDDSNAENNPLNEYPDEETSDDQDEDEASSSSDEESENDSRTSGTHSRDLENESRTSFENLGQVDCASDAYGYSEYHDYFSEGDDDAMFY